MANQNSSTAPVHSRLPNGRPRFLKICRVCGAESIVNKRQLLERPCLRCALVARDEPKARNRPAVHSRTAHGVAMYESTCRDCGRTAVVGIKGVGHRCRACASKARATHGLSNHPLYRIIKSAEARCRYPATKDFKWYGGRGITVCQEWALHPERFIEWALTHGWKRGLELDRIDNDGNYTPENCRFITHRVNSQNRRTVVVTPEKARAVKALRDSGKTASDVGLIVGVSRQCVLQIWNGKTWSNA